MVPFAEALSERYLAYALSTIMARSLPDVRDGLKPVHRRLLYAMRQLRLDSTAKARKSAAVVGDVMGNYHPHGDAAIYDAMVRLAQDFAVRYPLVDGQGNFGNIDGDNAAAMRYTEARLTAVADLLLQGIDEDAVDFRDTYDGVRQEPIVLPAAFPNLLANGSQGIAVGMATSIPPHNVAEICDALLHMIKFPKATIGKLVDLIPGPDFPTGGELVESRETIEEAYRNGRGSFRLRARWEVEKLKSGTWQIVVTEIPYQVQKSRLIERIAELLQERKLAVLEDVHDESTTDVRLILTPKSRNVDPEVLMESLFRQTDLETRFSLNMNVLDAGNTPRVMSLAEVLRAYLDHRQVVLQRRSKFRLAEIARRLEILEGYIVAYLNLDAVIKIIRTDDDPKAKMIQRWKLTDIQADAILNMKLKALRKLEEIEIKRGARSAHRRAEGPEGAAEGRGPAVEEDRRGDRRAEETLRPGHGARQAPHQAGRCADGRRRAARSRGRARAGHRGLLRQGLGPRHEGPCDRERRDQVQGRRPRPLLPPRGDHRQALVFGTNGRFYTIGADKLPGGRGHGEPMRLMIDLGNDQDIVAVFVHKPGRKLLVAADDGRGFIVPEDEVGGADQAGKQVLNVGEGDRGRRSARRSRATMSP